MAVSVAATVDGDRAHAVGLAWGRSCSGASHVGTSDRGPDQATSGHGVTRGAASMPFRLIWRAGAAATLRAGAQLSLGGGDGGACDGRSRGRVLAPDSRTSAANTTRSAQFRRGLGLVRRSTATSCRGARSSMSLVEDVRPINRRSPSRWWKIRYRRRSDTAEIMQGTGGHQSLLVSGMCSILEPHRVSAAGKAAGPRPCAEFRAPTMPLESCPGDRGSAGPSGGVFGQGSAAVVVVADASGVGAQVAVAADRSEPARRGASRRPRGRLGRAGRRR